MPFMNTNVDRANELGALIPDVTDLSYYIPGTSWSQWTTALPGFNNFYINHSTPIWAYIPPPPIPYEFNLTFVGRLPDMEDISYNLQRGASPWNAIMLPLHRDDLTNAEELSDDIPRSTSIARWISPGGYWQQWIPELAWLNNFPITVGHPYFVAVSENTIWPTYLKSNAVPNNSFTPVETGKGFTSSPALIYSEIDASGNITGKLIVNGDEKNVITLTDKGCGFEQGIAYFQLASLPDGYTNGDRVTVELVADGVEYSYELILTGSNSYKIGDVKTSSIPTDYALSSPYPNPFNLQANIAYDLPIKSDVELSVYNLLGEKIATLVNGEKPAGSWNASWDGRADNGVIIPSGVYFVAFRTDSYRAVKSLMLVK